MITRNVLIALADKPVEKSAPGTDTIDIESPDFNVLAFTPEQVIEEVEFIKELILDAAASHQWQYERDYSTVNRPITKEYLVAVAVKLKEALRDVMVIIDTGKLSITSSWHKSNEV